MSRLLIEGCDVVATMDDAGTEVAGGSILIEDGVVAWMGAGSPPGADGAEGAERLDGRGTVAVPGLINTHHHLYQTLTRARAQDQGLFGWLRELYPVWAGVDAEWERAAARASLAELALSGCTTTTDHHYLFPPGRPGILEAEIEAARQLGLRFHPCRGSMDLGESWGGLPPDSVVEDTDDALAATEEAVTRHHDPGPGSMLRIAVAPCSPFSVTERLMRESAELARRLDVRMHTHIAETREEESFCVETFDRRPLELLDDWGWLGSDVWLAHCVHLDDKDVRRVAETGTGVAWCPTSNLRLGSGIAPAVALLREGAAIGLGVDGSASNDAGNLLAELRQALLVSRARGASEGLSAREVLRVATRGGAACLGRDDLGSLEPGKRADVALFAVDDLSHAGGNVDPVAAVVLCGPARPRHLLVEGRPVVRNGRLATAEEDDIAAEAHRVARRIAVGTAR
ncbi:MAG: 8-oxoguanine deaminase [Actinobacteria bacterium]|nr:MAG: 8-oxoguanine deaminase [Actinomycetota bacterium]